MRNEEAGTSVVPVTAQLLGGVDRVLAMLASRPLSAASY